MSQIILKNSNVPSSVPLTSDLTTGELAINTADGKLFTKLDTAVVSELHLNNVLKTEFPSGFIASTGAYSFNSSEWLACDGSVVSTSSYPSLASLLPNPVSLSVQSNLPARNYTKIIYTGTYYVASVYGDRYIYYSTDKITWYASDLGSVQNINGVAYNPITGRYCAVTATGTVFYTDDLTTTWTAGGSFSWITAGFTNGIGGPPDECCFISTGQTSLVLGASRTERYGRIGRLPSNGTWSYIAYNGSVYCAILYGSSIAATSPDGVTWTQQDLPSNQNWKLIYWNGSVFCAIAYGSNVFATSTDGISWTQGSLPSTGNWSYIARNGSRIVVISNNSTTGYYSDDNASTWNAFTLPQATGRAIDYSPTSDTYFFLWNTTGSFYYSSDLITWTTRNFVVVTFQGLSTIVYLGHYVWLLKPYYTEITLDGTVMYAIGGFGFGTSIGFNNTYIPAYSNKLIAACNNATIYYYNLYRSQLNFTAEYNFEAFTIGVNTSCRDICCIDGKFYTIPSNGSCIMESEDGVNWNTGHLLFDSGNWTPPTYGDNKYVSLCANKYSGVCTTDGTKWNNTKLRVTANWQTVGWSDTYFFSAGYASNIGVYSYNGIDWYNTTLPQTKNYKLCLGANGNAAIWCYTDTAVVVSDNGHSWSQTVSLSNSANWNTGLWTGTEYLLLSYGSITGPLICTYDTTKIALPYIPTSAIDSYRTDTSYTAYIKL